MVSILHLSDIHCGPGELVDEDRKDHVPNSERLKQLARLRTYVTELSERPDFVVISGDISIRGQADGFRMFRDWLLELIDSGLLPNRERILVVPGNHDVTRQSREPLSRKTQFQSFWDYFGNTFPHCHIPDLDPKPTPTPVIDPNTIDLQGGINTVEEFGSIKLVSSTPFILSLRHDLLLYGFNSAHGCGVPGKPNTKIIKNLDSLIHIARKDRDAEVLDEIKTEYLDSLVIDAGMITDEQMRDFHSHMSHLQKTLGDRFYQLTKIAILHHHVSNLWSQPLELKKFEAVVDAAQFKQGLIEQAFDIVIHGHKHLNHVGLDGALIPLQSSDRYNPLCIISGGTIAGYPRHNDKATFKVIQFAEPTGPRRAGVVREIPIREIGNIREAIRNESRIYNIPVNNKIPELHDFSIVKNIFDDAVIDKCSPELKSTGAITARDVELANHMDAIFSGTFRYRCYAQLTDKDRVVFYEVMQVTKRLKFRDYSRLRWFVMAAKENFIDGKSNKIIINIGNFEGTHFSETSKVGEISESLKELALYLGLAINAGIVEIRVHNFSQQETVALTRESKI